MRDRVSKAISSFRKAGILEWSEDLFTPTEDLEEPSKTSRLKDPKNIINNFEIHDVTATKDLMKLEKGFIPVQLLMLLTNMSLPSNIGRKTGLDDVAQNQILKIPAYNVLCNVALRKNRVDHWKMFKFLFGTSLPDVFTELRYAIRGRNYRNIPNALITAGFNAVLKFGIHYPLQALQLISQVISILPAAVTRYTYAKAADIYNSPGARIGYGFLTGVVGLLTLPWQFINLTKLAYVQATTKENSRFARFGYGLLAGISSVFSAPAQVFGVLANTIGYTRHVIDSSVTFVKATTTFVVNIFSQIGSGHWYEEAIEKPGKIAWYSIKDFVNNGVKLLPVLAASALAFFTLGGSLLAVPAIAAAVGHTFVATASTILASASTIFTAAGASFLATAGAAWVAAASTSVLATSLITAGLLSAGAAITQFLSVGLIGIKKLGLKLMDKVSPLKVRAPEENWQRSNNPYVGKAAVEMSPLAKDGLETKSSFQSSDSIMKPFMPPKDVEPENKQEVPPGSSSPNLEVIPPKAELADTNPKKENTGDELDEETPLVRRPSLGGG